MRRSSNSLPSLLGLLLSGLLLSCTREAPRPHVFVFLVDTLRADHVGVYGYMRPTTPRLDEFAQDAVVFSNAYSPSPWTRPAIASLFSGLPPNLHGVRGRGGWMPPQTTTWAEALQRRGYRSRAWFTNANLEASYNLGQGFAYYEYETEADQPYLNGLKLFDRYTADLAEDEGSSEPLFHYLHLMEPHQPYIPRRPYRVPFVRQPVAWREWFEGSDQEGEQLQTVVNNYDAEIRQADDVFGRFVELLADRDWLESSWVVFTSDHGEEFREHGELGHGHGLYEALLRVPLIIRPPGGKHSVQGRRLAALADADLPLHALPDLIGAQWSDWSGLGRENLATLGLPLDLPEVWFPTPEAPAPLLRRASVALDHHAASMVANQDAKLVWRELPRSGWELYRDPDDEFEKRPDRVELDELARELEAWALSGWRGLRIVASRDLDEPVEIRTEPRDALQELRVSIGGAIEGLRYFPLRHERRVQWRARAGESIVLRIPEGGGLLLRRGEGDWSSLDERLAVELGLGMAWLELQDRAESGPGELSPELQDRLKALGYVE